MQVTLDLGSVFKWLVILVFAGVAFGTVMLVIGNIKRFFASRSFDGHDLAEMRRRWAEIERMAAGDGEVSRKVAVMEADKLLDHALKSLSMPGTTLGERLKFAQYKYPELRDVWSAHRVRNQLAHEASYHLDAGVAKRAIASFGKALKRMGAI